MNADIIKQQLRLNYHSLFHVSNLFLARTSPATLTFYFSEFYVFLRHS